MYEREDFKGEEMTKSMSDAVIVRPRWGRFFRG